MDASEKNIQALLQRTRPDALGPDYNRLPAGRPPVPPAGVETMWCRIVDGRDHGQAFPYLTDGTYGIGCYIDEVNPLTFQSFYPSRTRNASNEYQVTYTGLYYDFWPVPINSIVQARRWKYVAGPWLYWGLLFTPPQCCWAQVVTVDANGRVTKAYYANTYNPVLGYGIQPKLVNWGPAGAPPAGYVYYPYAKVDDWIPVSRMSSSVAYGIDFWLDMTPRIRLHSQAKVGASTERDVHVDISGGAPGVPWILDTDT